MTMTDALHPNTTVVRLNLQYRPRRWQKECHVKKARFKVLALHRRAGKTELGVRELYEAALSSSPHTNRLYVYMAPYLKQAKLIAWQRIKQIAEMIPGAKINESELCVTIPNGSEIRVFGGDNPDAMRGVRLDGIVVDEVAQIKPEVWNEIAQPALSDRLGWALFIGTPKGINMFSELFYAAQTLPDWFCAIYTVYDTDALDSGEVERLRRDMPENEFAREYLCDFSAASEDQLLGVGEVEVAARRVLQPHQYSFAPKILGVDVARFGDDRSVIILRQGLQCFQPKVFKGLDNMEFAAHVAQEINEVKPDAVFIDIGNGSGVVDRLRQMGYQVIEVNFGARALDPKFVNKRTEMWWLTKEWVEAGGSLPNNQELKQDLATPTYSFNAKNQYVLESKDDIKKRILRSTDPGDALALTLAEPVAPKNLTSSHSARGGQVQIEYDLFA